MSSKVIRSKGDYPISNKSHHLIFLFSLLCIVFSACKQQVETAEKVAETADFVDYYRYSNQAALAHQNGEEEKILPALEKAAAAFPYGNQAPIDKWVLQSLINRYEAKDSSKVIELLQKFPIYHESLRGSLERHTALFDEYATFQSDTVFFHPEHKKISAIIDTLLAVDQGLRDNPQEGDELLYPSTDLITDWEKGASYVRNGYLNLYQRYGAIGPRSCEKCHFLILFLIHLDNLDAFNELKPFYMEQIRQGKLVPNIYAGVHDRVILFDTIQNIPHCYYYFNFYDDDFDRREIVFMKDLSAEKTEEINLRRDSIGLPPLPVDYFNFNIN